MLAESTQALRHKMTIFIVVICVPVSVIGMWYTCATYTKLQCQMSVYEEVHFYGKYWFGDLPISLRTVIWKKLNVAQNA